MNRRWWRGPALALIALGWGSWVLALVSLLYCQGLQSGMLAAPGDPCRELRWIVIGGFVFLLFASILALAPPRRSEHEGGDELIDEQGRNPTQRRIDESRRRH